MARVEFSPENYDLLKLGMLVWCCWVAVNGTLFTLEMSYWGVARLDSILGGQKNINIDGDFFLSSLCHTINDIKIHIQSSLVIFARIILILTIFVSMLVPGDAVDSISFSGFPLRGANNVSLEVCTHISEKDVYGCGYTSSFENCCICLFVVQVAGVVWGTLSCNDDFSAIE